MTQSRNPVLAVDFDDVVAHFNATFAIYHNQTYGSDVSYTDICSYDMCQVWSLDHDTLIARVRDFCHTYHDQITPTHGATTVLPRLAERYELHIVTSRCESLTTITKDWLAAYGLEVFTGHHFTNGYGSLFPERTQSKLAVCREIGAQYLIEDALENARLVADGGIHVLVPNRPWNRESTRHARIIPDIRDWYHIERLLGTGQS